MDKKNKYYQLLVWASNWGLSYYWKIWKKYKREENKHKRKTN